MKIKCNAYWATLWQLAIALLFLWLTRFAFYWYNADVIGTISLPRLISLSTNGLRFDLSALAYANALFIVMRFLPFQFTLKRGWRIAEMIVYGICNSILLIINLGDTVYYRFAGGRMHLDGFLSLFNADMLKITFGYAGQYWWAFLGIVAVICLMIWLANRICSQTIAKRVWVRVILFIVAALLTFLGMRGSIIHRSIGIDTAGAYIRNPNEINVVLNTPFCIIRSTNYSKGMPTMIFFDDAELNEQHSSIQHPSLPLSADSIKQSTAGKNIMLIILESGGQIWFDSLNDIADEPLRGHTPFLNSIAEQSFAITEAFCTGNRTVEGLSSILGGIPTFGTLNWMATKYAALTVDSPARLLNKNGYSTSFFLGDRYELFALGALANAMGFNEVVSKEKIDLTENHNTNKWGYYDHIMAKYVAQQISEKLQQPFFATWLTLNLHGPYDVPEDIKLTSDDPILRGVEYMDYSIRCFFEEAKCQPWFDNTLFIITSDHGFRDFSDAKYNGAYIYGHVPFILYTPDGSLTPGKHSGRVMSQFDIAPTILWLAGYDQPYIAVGTNYFDDTKPHYGVQQRNGLWHITGSRYHLSIPLEADRVEAVYDPYADQQLLHPLTDYDTAEVDEMLCWLRGFLQDYTSRANSARLSLSDGGH